MQLMVASHSKSDQTWLKTLLSDSHPLTVTYGQELSGSKVTEALSSPILLHPLVLPRAAHPAGALYVLGQQQEPPPCTRAVGPFMTSVETAEIRKVVKRK